MTAKTLYRIGSVSMMIMGVGHTIIHFTPKGADPNREVVIQQMKSYKLVIAGVGRSLLEFHQGFSITLGVLLFFIGLQSWMFSGELKHGNGKHRAVAIVSATLATIVFLLSLKYFIIIPQVLSFIALVAYWLCFWKLTRDLQYKNL